jgi:2-oxoglutarate ferredoxin oxidoreductase subunit beta
MAEALDFNCDFENKWCPGCGNFAILESMKEAFAGRGLLPKDVLIFSGIGQAGKTPHFLKCNFFHGLHGRAIPVATGASVADSRLPIVVNMGDGDCYGEGGNHFLAAIRRNPDMTLLIHDNQVYGLTKGQASPTSKRGFVTRLQPYGARSDPLNPVALALSQGAGFVARAYCAHKEQLADLINQAMDYRGLAIINILQVCVSFNPVNTYDWYKGRVYDINKKGHRTDDFRAAMDIAFAGDEKIATGLIYKKERPCFADRVRALEKGYLAGHKYDPDKVQQLLDKA